MANTQSIRKKFQLCGSTEKKKRVGGGKKGDRKFVKNEPKSSKNLKRGRRSKYDRLKPSINMFNVLDKFILLISVPKGIPR